MTTGADRERGEIARVARPLRSPADLDPLVDAAAGCRYVLLGEASHGTSEYYRWRAELTRRLIAEAGFSFVAVEGDWPDCFEVNRWVKAGAGRSDSAREVLGRFARWPTWMWANDEVADFLSWLRDHNTLTGGQVGFYGLDVYSLWESMTLVVDYLREHHPEDLPTALAAWACFDPYGGDPHEYGWSTQMVPTSCEDEVVALLAAMHRHTDQAAGGDDPEAVLDAAQNAEVAAGAERYYRTMVQVDEQSWNVRDTHMADTLDRLMAHHGPDAKVVVWEHNTHVGDARATSMAASGMVNVGQLVRERHRDQGVFVVGMAGHAGTVMAAPAWGAPARVMDVPAAPAGTHEDLLADAGGDASVVVFGPDRSGPWLSARRGHRAIGVVYHPERERYGNWVPTVMGGRYDALCFFARTQALHPLHLEAAQPHAEQETYPWSQ